MVAITIAKDGFEVKKRINKTLQGPVSVILSGALADLSGLPKDKIYDHVLDNLPILTKSLAILRKDRRRFLDVLVDGKGSKVDDDFQPLACGRSLNEVVGMVIRSATKRYFRAIATSPTPLPHMKDVDQADQLYDAIREYLMHDWQVPLVPTYAEMTPSVAQRIGEGLMHIQDVDELRGLMDLSSFESPNPAKAVETVQQTEAEVDPDPFSLYISLDGKRLNIQTFEDITAKPEVKAAIGQTDMNDVLKLVGGPSAHFLVYGMGLTPEQFVVVVAAAHETMGADVFSRILGFPGERELVVKLAQYGLSQRINGKTPLADCSFFIKNFVSQAIKNPVPISRS